MGDVILQIWEESTLGDGIRQDGCSLHINNDLRTLFIDEYYMDRDVNVPNTYEIPVGKPCRVILSEELYNVVSNVGSVRLMQNELNNLFLMGDIIPKKD
jgi:hypothetical protein